MAIFVEDFMEGIMGDTELACYHEQFKDPEQMEILKEKLCQFFKFQLDGSRFYIGKPMADVHRNLGISDEIFDKACEVFTVSLKKLKPKYKVFKEFIKRISNLRSEICFPPVTEKVVVEPTDLTEESLFNCLGQEIGIRNIIDSMLEQARLNNFSIFPKINGE